MVKINQSPTSTTYRTDTGIIIFVGSQIEGPKSDPIRAFTFNVKVPVVVAVADGCCDTRPPRYVQYLVKTRVPADLVSGYETEMVAAFTDAAMHVKTDNIFDLSLGMVDMDLASAVA